MFAKVGDALLWEENTAKLLGILIDRDLSFNDHVKMICKKASQKLAAISRLANILSKDKDSAINASNFEEKLVRSSYHSSKLPEFYHEDVDSGEGY